MGVSYSDWTGSEVENLVEDYIRLDQIPESVESEVRALYEQDSHVEALQLILVASDIS